MGLSTTEKKIAVTVAVDASRAKRGFAEYEAAAKGAEKATKKVGEGLDVLHAREENARETKKKLAEAIAKMSAEQKRLAGVQAELDGAWKKGIGTLVGYGKAAGVAVAAVVGLAAVTSHYADESLRLQGLFANLPISIDAAAKATHGLVDNMTLATGAANAVALGVVKTSKDFATLAAGAQLLGTRVGTDATQALNDLTIALGRGSAKILDNLGIMLTEGDALKERAKDLKKNVAQLTETEKAEAFRVIALKRVSEETKKVTIDTNSAAAAIVKARVELENYKTALLGGEQGMMQLQSALVEMVRTQEIFSHVDLRRSHMEYRRIVEALEQSGVAAEFLATVTHFELADALDKARVEATRLDKAFAAAAAEVQRVKNVAWFDASAVSNASALTHEIDKEVALLQGMNTTAKAQEATEAAIEERLQRRAQILMEEAALRGDILKVTELVRQEEMRSIEASIENNKRRGGGDRFAKQKKEFAAQVASFHRAQGMKQMARSNVLFQDEMGPAKQLEEMRIATKAMGDLRKEDIATHLEQEQARNDALLAEKQRALELAVSLGVDPVTAIQREAQMTIDFHQREIELLRQHSQDKVKLAADTAQHEQAILEAAHAKKMALIQQEQKKRSDLAQLVNTLQRGMADVAMQAAVAAGASAKEQERVRRIAGAGQAMVDGTLEAIAAARAFASFNPIQGAMHTAASVFAFAKGALMQAGPISGSGGGGGPAAAPSGSASFKPENPRPAGEAKDQGSGAPISRGGTKHSGPKSAMGPGTSPTINFYSYLPADKKQMGMMIRQSIKHSEQEDGGI